MRLDDPNVVSRDYASEDRLLARRSVYETSEGPSALDMLWERIVSSSPRLVLEVGPGPGELAERMTAELQAEVVALDVSPRMVELTRQRGVDVRLGDVQALPFDDASFDLVVAAWVLFHPSDLNLALAEIARVLMSGGRLVAATNSEHHLAELWALVGHDRIETSFSLENGEASLKRHFADVAVETVDGWVTFPSARAAREYVASSIICGHLADCVPAFEGSLRVRRGNAILVATKL